MDLIEVKNRKEKIIVRHPWELARLDIVDSLLKNVIKNEATYSVLDIGCGDIFFVSSLADRYPKAHFYAIDIAFTDEMISMFNEEIRGKNIYLFKTMEDANRHLGREADLILLLDVIEHIENDVDFLNELHDNPAVSNNTNIMITVPAYQSLFCSHDSFLGHYRRYTNKTLLKTVQSTGFVKIKLGYFFFLLIPLRVIQVLKEKINKPRLSDETTGLVGWNKSLEVTNFIKSLLLIDFKIYRFIKNITGLSLPGLSNYIICKKHVS